MVRELPASDNAMAAPKIAHSLFTQLVNFWGNANRRKSQSATLAGDRYKKPRDRQSPGF